MRFPWYLAVVHGPSMAPALRHGDVVVVRRGDRRVRAGDVVVVRLRGRPEDLFVKRAHRRQPDGWWVLGDNEFVTDDSRAYGPGQVEGRVVARWRPRPGRVRRRAAG